MYAGGSGELYTTHVKFIVDPLSMYKSGAPIISVEGSEKPDKKGVKSIVPKKNVCVQQKT
jgi:hypothetical protein